MMLFISLVSLSIWQFTFAQEENSTTLETWSNFRFDLKTLASWDYKNVEKIREAKSLNSSCSNTDNETCKKISAEWEEIPVYARYKEDKKTIYYYTTATKIYLNPSSAQMFSSFNKLSEIVMTKFDTSKVTDMSSMFKDCKSLTTLDVSNFVTTNVTDMSNMFNGYKWTNLDLSSFNTSNVTNMNWMFNGYSWNVLDVSSFDTSKVTNMSNMFYGCNHLTTLDVSNFDTKNVTGMNNMFRGCNKLTSLDVSNFDTSKVTDMSSMFNGYKWTNLDVSNFDTSKVTDMNWMFNGYGWNILDVSNFDTSNVTNMNSMFYNCNKITNLDISNFDTSRVEDVHGMFNWCSNIEELDLELFNTMNVTNMNNMFNGCSKLTTIYVSNSFVLDNVTSSTDMFRNDKKLMWWNGTQYTWTHVTWEYAIIDKEWQPWYFSIKDKESIFLPWEKFNVKIKTIANGTGTINTTDSEIISIIRSYESPSTGNLEIISILWAKNPIYAWYDSGTIFYYTKSEKVYMNLNSKSMFQWLSSLKILDLKDVYTDNVTDMRDMFNNCSSLETLDVSNFNTSNVTNMERMFNNCSSLETLNLSNFNTSNVTNMNYMFNWCESLKTLNLENFYTNNAERMRNAFSHCKSLENLNLENFDTSKVENMNQMFYNMSNLKTIYVSDKFVTTALSWSTSYKEMFSGDFNLVWWNGTVYDSSMVESGYARIDNQTQSWYFTNILDKKYYITYNLDGWVISWEKTTYTQRDSFTLPIPIKEWYDFIWWTWSNLENLEIEVVIPEKTRWDLEYTANWRKVEQKSDDKYSWWGSRTSQAPESIEDNETKADEKEYNNWKTQGNSIENYDSDYSLEENEAYQFAYNNWITTMPSVVKANMYGSLNRIAMAKMLSNYAINVLWKKPSNIAVPEFSDVTQELEADYWWAVSLSYQLWIMWINISEFRPFDVVTRWEFATALSRMLFWITDGDVLYYEPHIKKLFEKKIISITNPNLKELRWYVMIMLMRSAKNK